MSKTRALFVPYCLFVLIVLLTGVAMASSRRDVPSSENEPSGKSLFGDQGMPEYRRIFFPQNKIAEMPMSGRYPPISAEQFHRRMEQLQRFGRQNGEFDNGRTMKSLDLAARLDGKQLVAGKGVIQIGSFNVLQQTETNAPATSPDDPENESPRVDAESRKDDHAVGWPIVLSPFQLAVSEPYWSDGTPGRLGLAADNKTVLYALPENNELRFNWTLQGESNASNDLFFAFDLPQFLQIRLFLDLPDDKKPIVSSGIVRPVDNAKQENDSLFDSLSEDVPAGYRRWQITFNSGQQQRVIISPDESRAKYHGTIAVSEHHRYDISLYGVQFNSLFFIEKSEFVFTELLVELDKPLSPLSLKSGDRLLAWTEVPSENENVTRLLVSMPSMESGTRRLQVQAFCPTQIDRLWELPKIRILSPLFFWNETRNIVHVNRPLLTRRLVTPELRQEESASSVDDSESDLFVFQSFSENSTIGIELGVMQPQLLMQSGTVFQWGERELSAKAVLNITAKEGQVSQLDLDVDANWTVDLIEAADPTRVANYFVDETDDESATTARWAVTLRRAIDSSQPIRLIVQLRRPLSTEEQAASNDPAQHNRYPLTDFTPIRVLNCRKGTQLIAFNMERRYRLIAPHEKEDASPSVTREQIRELFDEAPFGTVLACDSLRDDAVLEIEAAKPIYSVSAMTRLVFQNGLLTESCRFHCVPAENSRLNRLTVYFSGHNQSSQYPDWTWRLGDEPESSQQIRATKSKPPQTDPQVAGEVWELDLTPARSTPFDITATRIIPFESEAVVALPFFPDIANVDACLTLETRDATLYRITQNPTRAVSIDPLSTSQTEGQSGISSTVGSRKPSANETNKRMIRGIYRYEGNDRTLLSKNAVFAVTPVGIDADIMPDGDPVKTTSASTVADASKTGKSVFPSHNNTGNIWQMALHSHVYPRGEIVSYAVMMLENRAMDQLKIGFSPDMTPESIRSVWVDDTKVTWDPYPNDKGGFDLVIDIPTQQRFLNVIVEYVCIQKGKRLRPQMPTLSIPVIMQKWYVWHSLDYRGFSDSEQRERGHLLSTSVFRSSDSPESSTWSDSKQNVSVFDVFMSPMWLDDQLLPGKEKQLLAASRQVAGLLADEEMLKKINRRNRQNGVAEKTAQESSITSDESSLSFLRWSDLFSSEVFHSAVSGSLETDVNSTSSVRNRKILIDYISMTRSEIVPDGLVFMKERNRSGRTSKGPETTTPDIHGLALLERNGLAVIFDGHDNVLITTVLTAAKLRHQLVPVYAELFWYAPSDNFTEWEVSSSGQPFRGFVSPLAWQAPLVPLRMEPWFSDLSSHTRAYHPGWVVQEITYTDNAAVSLQLIYGNTVLCFQLCAFFAVLVLSWRCPMKYQSWLIVTLILALVLADRLPLPWVPVAYGLFWGGICAMAFGLIRYFHVDVPQQSRIAINDDETTIAAIYQLPDDSEPGEIRNAFASLRESPKNVESLSDTQQDSDSDAANAVPTPPPSLLPEEKKQPDDSSYHRKKSWSARLLWLAAILTAEMTMGHSGFVAAQTSGMSDPLTPSSGTAFSAPEQQMPFSEIVRDILESRSSRPPYQVFIPYDKDGQPGNRYYIPEQLYRHLQQADQNANASANWQIRSARYTGTLAMQNKLTPFNLRAVYEIELNDQSAKVRLPEMPLLPDTVRCDSQMIQPTIEPVGQGATARNEYVFTLSGQGRHLLEFAILPGVYDDPESQLRHFNFPIPRVPDSTFTLTLPLANLPVEVSPILGQVTRIGDQWKAELGPVDRLSLSWPIRSSNAQNSSVSQYLRFHVDGKRIGLQTRYRFNVSSGGIRHVLLDTDPRYKRVGDYRVSAEVESIDPVPGAPSLVSMTLRNPVTESLIVEADYIPQNISGSGDFSGTGTLALPKFSVVNARIERSWLGVSVDASTEIELPLSNVETKMFENAWGAVDVPVHFAFDLLRPMESNWFLSAKSRPLLNRISQRQWALFRDRSVFMYVETDVTPGYESGSFELPEQLVPTETIPVFHHEMILPESFQLESVELKDANFELCDPPRVEQNGRQTTLFFKEPIFGKYTVSVAGAQAVEPDGEIAFPLFDRNGHDVVSRSVFCYRDSSVLVDLKMPKESFQAVEAAPITLPAFSECHHIASFRIESPEVFSTSTIAFHRNRPKISGNMVSRLENNIYPNERWGMTIIWDLSISEGELDQVSIFLPVSTDNVSIFPSMPFRSTQKPNGTLIQINPREPLKDHQYFWIRFPIGGTLDVVSVPKVIFQHENTLQHYVALYTQVAFQPLNWSLTNLEPTDLTLADLTKPPSNDPISNLASHASSTHRYYHATRPDFSARTSYVEDNAFVSCHDLTYFMKKDGFCLAMSEFDIHANGASHCDIRFPETLQLIQMRINDIFPMPQQLDERTFCIELLSDVPMQRLTMVYCSTQKNPTQRTEPSRIKMWKNGKSQAHLDFPQILSFPVQKTLWELYLEQSPQTDDRLDVDLHLCDGGKFFDVGHTAMITLPREKTKNLQARMGVARLNQLLLYFRMMSSQTLGNSTSFDWRPAWNRKWRETQERTLGYLAGITDEEKNWNRSFALKPLDDFQHLGWETTSHLSREEWGIRMGFVEQCFSPNKTPKQIYDDIIAQHKSLSKEGANTPQGEKIGTPESEPDREYFMRRFWNDREQVHILAGVAPYGMTGQTLTMYDKKESVWHSETFRYLVWGIVLAVMLVLAIARRSRQIFKRFSILFVLVLMLFCWLFLKPNLLGWLVLVVLFLSAIRIQWNQMRIATNAVRQDQSAINPKSP